MGWTSNGNDNQQFWQEDAADAANDQLPVGGRDGDAPIQAVVAQDFSTRRLPAISDTQKAPVIVRGSGVSMGKPFIKRRERPLTLRIAVLTLLVCILVTGIFAFSPLGNG